MSIKLWLVLLRTLKYQFCINTISNIDSVNTWRSVDAVATEQGYYVHEGKPSVERVGVKNVNTWNADQRRKWNSSHILFLNTKWCTCGAKDNRSHLNPVFVLCIYIKEQYVYKSKPVMVV